MSALSVREGHGIFTCRLCRIPQPAPALRLGVCFGCCNLIGGILEPLLNDLEERLDALEKRFDENAELRGEVEELRLQLEGRL